MNIITDPIILTQFNPHKFKIVCGVYTLGFLPNDYASICVSDDGGQTTNIDHSDTRLVIRNIPTKQNRYQFINQFIFTAPLSYMNKLKGFKINNSYWVYVELYEYLICCKGKIVCSTPLDMMAVCNELFDVMTSVVEIYFPVVKI